MNNKVLIIGVGSIGQRHKDTLFSLGCLVKTLSKREGVGDFQSLEAALQENFDFIVIASETVFHIPILKQIRALEFSGHVFVEKPVAMDVEEMRSIQDNKNTWVGYNLRFHPAILKVKDYILSSKEKYFYAHFHVGQLLSSWRTGRNHFQTYSVQKKLGGGVIYDLSHEIDLAQWLFGEWRVITSCVKKLSDLTYDSEDLCLFIASGQKCPVISMNLNYLDKMKKRHLFISGTDNFIEVNLIDSKISIGDQAWQFSDGLKISYDNMWKEALSIVRGAESKNFCTLNEGKQVQETIEKIYEHSC